MLINLHAVRGEFAGVFDGAAHGAAFLHLDRAGGQLVGANHFGGIEGNFLAGGHGDGRASHHHRRRGGHIRAFNAAHTKRVGLGLVLDDRAVWKLNAPSIGRRRRDGKVIAVNAGQDKGGIELTANGQQ